MNHKRQVKAITNNEIVDVHYSNWAAQMVNLMSPRDIDVIAGRGAAKTTEIIVGVLEEIIYEMPGAPLAWVSDTYQNLKQNVLPMVLESLERKGFHQGVHFVIEKTPPTFTHAEIQGLDEWLRPHFWKPFNHIVSYKHTLIFFTGTNITFGSLDRPASLAGRSYVYVFGDEVKYFKESKIANILKAVRGYELQFGSSHFYRGHCFTTDMPNPDNIGEHDWIIRQGKSMDVQGMKLLLKCALIVNEIKHDIVALVNQKKVSEAKKKRNLLSRWETRLLGLRKHKKCHHLFLILSSFVNVDILSTQWFIDAIKSGLSDLKTAVLSCMPSVVGGERFYASMTEKHYYKDGNKIAMYDEFSLTECDEDCRILKYLQSSKPLEISLDFGNQNSMTIGQSTVNDVYVLKTIYTLSPEWLRELATKFIKYFKPHSLKRIDLYYDRAGNNYKNAKQDLATVLKSYIEKDDNGHSTGWTVRLMSLGQANIPMEEEYNFMHEIFSENNSKLPKIHIDFYNCKPLRCSLDLARTKKVKGKITKDKRSEKLPFEQLPLRSTNYSDSFKYLLMRKKLRDIAKKKPPVFTGAEFHRGSN